MIWAHCAEPEHLDQIRTLENMLREDGDTVEFLCTLRDPQGTGALAAPTGQREVRKFLFSHRPVAALWIGGILDQATLAPCFAVELPVIVLEGSERMLSRIMGSWMPHRARATLETLHAVLAQDERSKREFVAGGAREDIIHVAGSIADSAPVLEHREDDRVELAQTLGTRPVWLAASASPRDTSMLCDAHKEASRRAHRLMLIIAPARPLDGHEIAAQCRAMGFNTALRSEGAEPEEATQIYIADEDDSLGLWYRLSPITFLAGSFGSGAMDDPYNAAALGSVLIHGPAYGAFSGHFTQLLAVEATSPLRHPDDLGGAVAQLLSVDYAAAKANAGWDVTSRGAGAAALVSGLIQDILDRETS